MIMETSGEIAGVSNVLSVSVEATPLLSSWTRTMALVPQMVCQDSR